MENLSITGGSRTSGIQHCISFPHRPVLPLQYRIQTTLPLHATSTTPLPLTHTHLSLLSRAAVGANFARRPVEETCHSCLSRDAQHRSRDFAQMRRMRLRFGPGYLNEQSRDCPSKGPYTKYLATQESKCLAEHCKDRERLIPGLIRGAKERVLKLC